MPPLKLARSAPPEPAPPKPTTPMWAPDLGASWGDSPAIAGALSATPALPSTTEPAYPDSAAKVRMGGEPGRFLAALWVSFGRSRFDLEVACTRRTGAIEITLDGRVAGHGLWKKGKIIDVSLATSKPVKIADLEGPLNEIALAMIAGERDPDLLEAAADIVPYEGGGTVDEAIARGDANEQRGLGLVRAAIEGLPWAVKARKARLEEDRRGIDVVVETKDAGDLYVQIKSSEAGAMEWKAKYHTRPVFVRSLLVIFVPGHPSTKLASVTTGLARLHERFVVRSMTTRSDVQVLPDAPPAATPGTIGPLRLLVFPGYPNAVLVHLPEGSTASAHLPPLTAPFTRASVGQALRDAELRGVVSEAVPGRWTAALTQARSADKAERTNLLRARERNEAMLLRGSAEPEARERSRVMLEKHSVDEECAALKAKIRAAKVQCFERGIYLPPGEFHRLETTLDQKQLESQALQIELVRLRDAERKKNREIYDGERDTFFQRFFEAAKSTVSAETMAALTALAEGDDEEDEDDSDD